MGLERTRAISGFSHEADDVKMMRMVQQKSIHGPTHVGSLNQSPKNLSYIFESDIFGGGLRLSFKSCTGAQNSYGSGSICPSPGFKAIPLLAFMPVETLLVHPPT